MHDWTDDIVERIERADVTPVGLLTPHERAQLIKYQKDPVGLTARINRTRRWLDIAEPALKASYTGGFALMVLSGVVFVTSTTVADIANIMLSVGTIFFALSFVVGFLLTIVDGQANALAIINKHADRYLPTISYTVVGNGLQISLGDMRQTYASKIFSASEEQAALEYQVECETIIADVREHRTQQFIEQAVSVQHPAIEPAAQPPAIRAMSDDIKELQETLFDQREYVAL